MPEHISGTTSVTVTVTIQQADQTKLKGTVYQAEKDRTVTGTVTVQHGKTLKTAPISCATSGDNTIVSAVSGKKIKVYAIVLNVTGTVNVKWKRGSTDLTGDMNFQAREGYTIAVTPPASLLETAVNEALVLNLSGAVAVDGWVAYWDDDAS